MAKVKMRRVSRYSNEFKITAIRLASLPVSFALRSKKRLLPDRQYDTM